MIPRQRVLISSSDTAISTVGEAGAEIEAAASVMSKVGAVFTSLSAIGFVVINIVGILEIVEGAEQ